MKPILVSIIVPIYNSGEFLCACLDSIIAQTYKNIEVLLIDDGSLDNSAQICETYVKRDSRVYKFSKSNGGLSSARNYGINRAKGDYVMFIDSDDFWCNPTFLEKMLTLALSSNADIVRGELKEVNVKGEDIKGYRIPASRSANAGKVLNSGDFLERIMCRDFFVVLSLYKRQILLDIRFDEAHKFQEDIEFHIRLFLNNLRCIYLPICFYAYRKRAGSLTNEVNVNRLKFSFMLCDIYDKYSLLSSNSQIYKLYQAKSVMMYYWTMGTLSEDPYYLQRQYIIDDLNLRDLQLRTRCRAIKHKVWNKALIFSCLPPNIGVIVMRFKNYVVTILHHVLKGFRI